MKGEILEATLPTDKAHVLVDNRDGVVTLQFDRPDVRNALDLQTWAELGDALTNAADDPQARAIVLSGGDTSFSAGGDLNSMPRPGRRLMAPADRLTAAHSVLTKIAAIRVPVVAAVERYGIGAAWSLALACDLVVAGEQAFFQAPFASRGLIADSGAGWHLSRRLGHQRAARYLLLGERMTAQTAYELGLVSHLTTDGVVTAKARTLAGILADGPGESNALTKSLIRRAGSLTLADYLETERVAFALAAHGRDAHEGLTAFFEKREPCFR